MLTQNIVGNGPEVIGEIACEHGGNVHFTPEIAVGFMDNGGYGEGQTARRCKSRGRVGLDEHGKFPEVYLYAL